ncbi:interleukin-18 [Echinops telfairi]|uniref:Interleukin-18 n=1 Tax=Echinops telfairi TaxID=9371 RepID=A0ABM0ZPI0_ECHTE|nr:interleukin-18 [Echinops telfairi]
MKMAAGQEEDNYINFIEMKFINNSLYFLSDNYYNMESDYFSKLGPPKFAIIRNVKDQVLFINQGKQPLFEDMPDYDCRDNAPQTTFIIKKYKDTKPRSLPVSLSVKYMNKTHTVSCENKTINFKEISPPEAISDTKSDVIFFMRNVRGRDKCRFESSLYPGLFSCFSKRQTFTNSF